MNPISKLLLSLAVLALADAPAARAGCDATAIVDKLQANLRGPGGKMGVATGTLTYGGGVKSVKLAHYVSPAGDEAFQGEDRSTNEGLLRKIRVIRRSTDETTALLFVPSMRQGRKMEFKPTRSLFGTGEYHYYLLLPLGALSRDYTFACETGEGGAVVLRGTRKAEATLAPYPTVTLNASPRGETWIVEQATCEGTADFPSFTQTFGSWSEIAPGHWAPKEIRLNEVSLALAWSLQPATEWIVSAQTKLMEQEDIP